MNLVYFIEECCVDSGDPHKDHRQYRPPLNLAHNIPRAVFLMSGGIPSTGATRNREPRVEGVLLSRKRKLQYSSIKYRM